MTQQHQNDCIELTKRISKQEQLSPDYKYRQKLMDRLMKIFRVVILISMILTLSLGAASLIGFAFTGFYPGIIVLLLLTLIPIASNFFAKKINNKSIVFQRNYYIIFTTINLLTLLVALWMTFVILVDRVFPVLLR